MESRLLRGMSLLYRILGVVGLVATPPAAVFAAAYGPIMLLGMPVELAWLAPWGWLIMGAGTLVGGAVLSLSVYALGDLIRIVLRIEARLSAEPSE